MTTAPNLPALALLILAWGAYGALHSLLAARAVKDWVSRCWPTAGAGYRLAYNMLAVLLLIPPLTLTYALRGPWLWQWQGAAAWLADGVAVLAAAGFALTAGSYDMGEFLGLRQWRLRLAHPDGAAGPLALSPLHRWVRHPWYFLGLLILWSRDMDTARLVSALCISGYLAAGAWLEERKLLALHGAAYRYYRGRVPALLPRPWRRLDRAGLARLRELAADQAGRPPRASMT